MAKPNVNENQKKYILHGLELAKTSAERMSSRKDMLPSVTEAHGQEIAKINAIIVHVQSWDVV